MLNISLPKTPVVKEDDKKNHRAVVEISELYPGYGWTIGNSLRRILYSSLPGAAITSVKVKNVPHEFSTIDGVLEDMLEISLNLKEVHLVLHGEEPQTMTLKVKGKKDVTAKDIDTPSQVEVINEDAHIATITNAKTTLEMELTVERGVGYVQADQDEKEKKEIGMIHLDAIFSPVLKVNYEVDNMRVGDRTDFNRLLLDVTTDGSITPQQAFEDAVDVLGEHVNILQEFEAPKPKKTAAKKSVSTKKTTSGKGGSASGGKKGATAKKKSTTTTKKSTTKKKK